MKEEIALNLISKTRKDYNRMAQTFSSKRAYLTDDIKILKKFSKKGDRILDLGCGNGRLSELFSPPKDYKYLGLDFSRKMVAIAKQKYPANVFKTTPLLKLNLKNNSFDIVYFLSVFHHIPSENYRQRILHQIWNVLKPGGNLVLTVWKISDQNFKDNQTGQIFKQIESGDTFIPFKDNEGSILANRYFHKFYFDELKEAIKKAGFKIVEVGLLSRGQKVKNKNYYIVGKK